MAIAAAGTNVGLFVDLVATVSPGDVIETRSGRRYGVESVRRQESGKHAGRQHLRVVVLDEDAALGASVRVHRIRWYARKAGSGSGGITRRASTSG